MAPFLCNNGGVSATCEAPKSVRPRPGLLFSQGKHIHQVFDDFGEAMTHVEGAVVVRRPDLIDVDSASSLLAPAGELDFARTLMSYFPRFKSSLCPRYGLSHDTALCGMLWYELSILGGE